MNTPGRVMLIVCWIVWFAPFARAKLLHSRPSVATAAGSKWGLWLQLAAYALEYLAPSDMAGWRVIAGMIIAPVTVVFTWVTVRHLGKQWRILAGLYADHELVRTGPYSVVRHPVYLAMLGMFVAGGLMLTPWPVFVIGLALFIAGTEIRVRIEDELLAQRFGAEWRAWRDKTPAYVPFIR